MRRQPLGLTLILALWATLAVAQADPSTARKALVVPDGTPVLLRPQANVSGDKAKPGQEIMFTVVSPVNVQGTPVVAAGAPAIGTVIYAAGSGMTHPHGALIASVESVQAVDGSWLSLRARQVATNSADSILPEGTCQRQRTGFRGRHEHVVLPTSITVTAFVDRERRFEFTAGGSPSLRALPPSPPPAAAGTRSVMVEETTPVSVSPAAPISSATAHKGDRIEFRTAAPVTVDGVVVINGGARALGTVLLARPAARMSKAGELLVCVDVVQAASGAWIPVGAAGERRKGKKHPGARVALTHFVPVVAMVKKGQEAVVPPSTTFKLEVREDSYVTIPAP